MPENDDPLKLGLSLLQKEKYLDALRELSKLEPTFDGKKDDDAAAFYSAMSQCYYGMEPKSDENSSRYAGMALEIHLKLGDPASSISDLVYLSYIETDASKHKEAEGYLDEAIKISKEIGDDQTFAEILTIKADLLSGQKRRQKDAESLYAESAKISEKNELWSNYFEAACGSVRIKREEGDPSELLKETEKLMTKAENIANSMKTKKDRKAFADDVAGVYDLASDLAMEEGNVDQAMEIAKRLSKLAST